MLFFSLMMILQPHLLLLAYLNIRATTKILRRQKSLFLDMTKNDKAEANFVDNSCRYKYC